MYLWRYTHTLEMEMGWGPVTDREPLRFRTRCPQSSPPSPLAVREKAREENRLGVVCSGTLGWDDPVRPFEAFQKSIYEYDTWIGSVDPIHASIYGPNLWLRVCLPTKMAITHKWVIIDWYHAWIRRQFYTFSTSPGASQPASQPASPPASIH